MNNIITVEQIMALGPCYTEDRVRALIPSGQCTIREIIDAPIPWPDRLWALNRVVDDDRMWRMFACDCAERALIREREAGREPDARSWRAIEVARAYARGEATKEELSAACAAACAAERAAERAAARAAARDAAWAAACAAACAAERAAARAAACAAACAAARAAARDAACAAEYDWQRARLIEMMEASQCRAEGRLTARSMWEVAP